MGVVYLVVFPLKSVFLQVLWVEIDGQRPVLAWEVIRVLRHVFSDVKSSQHYNSTDFPDCPPDLPGLC